MKKLLPILFVAIAVASLVSCGKSADDGADTEINNFDVHEVLKSAGRNFEVSTPQGDTFYLSVYTSIQWPLQFGKSNLEPLRDSLLVRMYDVQPGTDVDAAILAFVNNDTIFGPGAKFKQVDIIPMEGPDSYEVSYTGKLIELTERTVTYQINASSYLGGPHGNTYSLPFTYDLRRACILTTANVFKPGHDKELLSLITQTLADQEEVTPAQLAARGFFVDDFYVSPLIYITSGGVVFHYNPYSIAPYSKGEIDIEVPAYLLSPYLTATADSLINQ